MQHAIAVRRKGTEGDDKAGPVTGTAVLRHDERHLRRKAITLTNGLNILVDLAEPVLLASGDVLLLDDGSIVEIRAADEPLLSIRAADSLHLMELAWHIGNRHLAAEILQDQIVIARDHVIRDMLEKLGAAVTDISAPFNPVRGAYAGSGHSHSHHSHDHAHP